MASRAAIQSHVEGLEASRAALERILRAEIDGAGHGLELVGQEGVRLVQRHITRQRLLATGRMRRGWTYRVSNKPGARYVDIETAVEYDPYHEYGTVYLEARPHARPAFDELAGEIPAIVGKAAERAGAGASSGNVLAGAARTGRNVVRRTIGAL